MNGKYEVIRGAVGREVLNLVHTTLVIMKDAEYHKAGVPLSNVNHFVDHQSPNSWKFFGPPVTEALLVLVQPLMQRVTGKRLFPVNSYGRIYWNGSILPKHRDREGCELSATVCIFNNPAPWPIFMDGTPVELEPGDLVVYKGVEVEHWRERYTGIEQVQVFLHYVDQDGPYADQKFNKRPLLGAK
jgi:hypothetical protein